MAKTLHSVTAVLVIHALVLTMACILWPIDLLLILALFFGTTAYHFAMRLAVGWGTARIMHGQADLTRRRYQPRSWEAPLYEALRVRYWKAHVPSYDPAAFSPALHTWREIAHAMCQAETVHLLCAGLSFLPLLLIIPFGQPLVFSLTSALAALIDLCLVAVQRFNRPTVLRLVAREAGRSASFCSTRGETAHYNDKE